MSRQSLHGCSTNPEMSNVTPTVPPTPPTSSTTAVTASPGSAEDPSHQQQQAGSRQSGGQASQQQAPAPAAPAVTLAASVVGLREGMRLRGAMVGSDANGQPVVRTPNGTFILETAAGLLSANAELELEIRGAGSEIRALILSIGGKAQHPPKELKLTLTGVGTDSARARATTSGVTAPLAAVPRGFPTPTLTIGSQLSATVQSVVTPNAPALLPGGITLSPGATLILKLVNVVTPNTPSAPSTPGTSPEVAGGLANEVKAALAGGSQGGAGMGTRAGISGNTAHLASVTSLPGAGTPSAPSTPTPPGPPAAATTLATSSATPNATLVTPQTPALPAQSATLTPAQGTTPPPAQGATPTPTSGTQATAARLSGEVISQAGTGRVMVRTPLGDVALITRAGLAVGTRLEFETVALRAPEVPPAPSLSALTKATRIGATGTSAATSGALLATAGTIGEEATAAVRAFANQWPALKEAVALLQSINPGLAQQVINTVMPSANTALGNSILMFLAAIRGGDVRGWLGEPASRALEGGGGRDLLNRLTSDMAQMGRAADASTSGDWRALPFPFFDGANLQQIWAFVREHRRAADQEDQRALRFVLELNLSKLGGIQLDGLIQDKQFNLMIRSVGTLPENIRQDIAHIYDNSLDATGYSGSVIFDPGSIYPISPLRDAQQSAAQGGEITA